MTTLNWKPSESRWNQGEQLYLGQFKIASAYYDATHTRGQDSNATRCSLPGLKGDLGHFPDMPAAKDAVEKAVAFWLKKTGLQFTEVASAKAKS